jgi:hypothetical protein
MIFYSSLSDSEGGDKIKGHPTRRQVIWSQCSDPLLGRDEVTRTNRGAEGIGRDLLYSEPYLTNTISFIKKKR